MQCSNQFIDVKCISCDREIDDQPVIHNNERYHASCYEEGRKRLQYARELANSFDFHALLYKKW